ncbi:MAG: phosphoribosylformylglycinamidine cyclo-ligase [Bacteroidetes bacterium]|nr:MAG: phosphoribosylformylglycinamidine cyclo-ligase [Bacteroidota bacterium]
MTTYREAGVDIEVGERVIDEIKPLVRKTFTPGVLSDIGSFGALYRPDFASYSDPVLVSSVDGVGTKLKVAFQVDRHDTVGQDLVNHCVNDIAVCGATPLYFLDYFATGKLIPTVARDIIAGFSKACLENGCALIGGETAEMPDLYQQGEYDLAGTIVGMVDRGAIIDGQKIESGDVLIGIPSSGLHTNGYSLARSVLFSKYDITDTPEELSGRTIGDVLLEVHRSYLHLIRGLVEGPANIRGLVHVTGGGIPGNTARIVPKRLRADINYESWDRPPIFKLIQRSGNVPESDMRRTFNLGIGLIIIVHPDDTRHITAYCEENGEHSAVLGSIGVE